MDNSNKKDKLITTSPCVGVCSTTFGDEICFGCQRRYDEVIQWNTLSDEEKDKINRRLIEEKRLKQSAG